MTTVLVVDDEAMVRNGLAMWLGRREFSVFTASNLRSACSVAEKSRPDVVLLDIKLGTEDGLQLIGLLRSLGLVIPCVVLTAHAGPYDGFKARELGVVRLIEKPSSPDEIAGALRHAAATTADSEYGRPTVQVEPPGGCLGHRVRNAINCIEAGFTDAALSAEDVADHVGVTPAHLSRLFDESLGKSPLTVINELRIRRAQQLLADPRLNLSEIANLCGYRSTRQLNSWFKLFCGQAPALRRLGAVQSRSVRDQETDQNIN